MIKPFLKILLPACIFINAISCRHITYTPRSKKQVQREKPSVVLIQRIIEYRETYNSWPFSKEEFTSKGRIFKEEFDRLPYLDTRFEVIDNNTMNFHFSNHKKDAENYKSTGQVDLNSYGGRVKFFWEKDKFIWKLKMY